MPEVFPFQAVQYRGGTGDLSRYIAPPYDVLDARAKAALLARDDRNIVRIDLPHTPPSEAGPPETYDQAARTLHQWLADGTLARRDQPAMFVYRQRFTFRGSTCQRCGIAGTVELVPFGPRTGGGVLPHEETFSGPRADRLALLRATRAQFSPIFALHPDTSGAASATLASFTDSRPPDAHADLGDGVVHELWTLTDPSDIRACRDALAGEDLFIADGHHRYTTALTYFSELEARTTLPQDHPARRCLMVLVSMRDPGLVIGPTHRVLGSMQAYSLDRLEAACRGLFRLEPAGVPVSELEQRLDAEPRETVGLLGLYDYASGTSLLARPAHHDPLADLCPDKPLAWRTLDVAIVQHLLVEQVCMPQLNAGQRVDWAFPHTIEDMLELGRQEGQFRPQLGVVLRPTPLEAVRQVSLAGHLMPQKSTFFYPKLATGLFIHLLA